MPSLGERHRVAVCRVGAKRIEEGIAGELRDAEVSLLDTGPQPEQRQIMPAESRVEPRDADRIFAVREVGPDGLMFGIDAGRGVQRDEGPVRSILEIECRLGMTVRASKLAGDTVAVVAVVGNDTDPPWLRSRRGTRAVD